jgi:23S rRNA (pseudouridine1915-N3)-methyltransferase
LATRLHLLAVGRLKAGPERELVARYLDRAADLARSIGFGGVDLREIAEGRDRRAEERKAAEAAALRAITPPGRLVLLDETGRSLTSEAWAGDIAAARDGGLAGYTLVIGGPDGFDPDYRKNASLVIAFGAMTWPHQLVRIMAAEQIYRALTILAGHPYHRK